MLSDFVTLERYALTPVGIWGSAVIRLLQQWFLDRRKMEKPDRTERVGEGGTRISSSQSWSIRARRFLLRSAPLMDRRTSPLLLIAVLLSCSAALPRSARFRRHTAFDVNRCRHLARRRLLASGSSSPNTPLVPPPGTISRPPPPGQPIWPPSNQPVLQPTP